MTGEQLLDSPFPHKKRTISLSWKLRAAVFAGMLLAACGAVWVGLDLYSGFANGIFHLVRRPPVTAADGFRYWLLAVGETLAVLALSGITVSFLFLMMGRLSRRRKSIGSLTKSKMNLP